MVFSSDLKRGVKFKADGIFGDKPNQNLWIYTADCMPILFADKRKRIVAAVHCGRKGLEKRIISNLVKAYEERGSSREDILVAIGPSISKKNYIVDEQTLKEFQRNTHTKELNGPTKETQKIFNFRTLWALTKPTTIQLDLKEYAHNQLLKENITDKNIEFSNLCTYELKNEFYSWRRNKTVSRQWSFIST